MSKITARAIAAMMVNATPTAQTMPADNYVFSDYTQRVIVAILMAVISVFGILGNSLVLFAVSLSKKLQTKVNVFVVNLSIADSIICCVLPFSIASLVSQSGWPHSRPQKFICSAAAGLLWISLGSGTITLALIAFNRYYVIRNNNFSTAYTSRRIAFMIVFSWLYPGSLVVGVTEAGFGRLGYSEKYKACLQDSNHEYSEYLSLFAGVTVFVPSLIVIFFCYIMIFLQVRKHHRDLVRLFISGGGGGERTRNESFLHSGVENLNTPQTPTEVRFHYPPISPGMSHDASNLSSTPGVNAASPSNARSVREANSPMQVDDMEGDFRGRNQSVSEELSHRMSRRQADITRNLFYVVCAFLLCLTPYGLAILLPNSEPGIPWVMLLLQFNTCVNPVIYAFKHPTFRNVIPRILLCDYANIPEQSSWLKKLLRSN